MSAIRPSYPRLARFNTCGELIKRTSSSVACGRNRSTRRSSTTLAASASTRHKLATNVVRRRAFIAKFSRLKSHSETSSPNLVEDASFQIPVFKYDHRATQSHRSIGQRIKSILQDKLPCDRLLVCHRADHVKRRKVWHQIGRTGRQPTRQPVSHGSEAPQIFRKTPDHEQCKGEDCRQQGRGKRGEQQRQRTDDEEFKNNKIKRHQNQRVRARELMRDVQ